jgi:hypothetical protein
MNLKKFCSGCLGGGVLACGILVVLYSVSVFYFYEVFAHSSLIVSNARLHAEQFEYEAVRAADTMIREKQFEVDRKLLSFRSAWIPVFSEAKKSGFKEFLKAYGTYRNAYRDSELALNEELERVRAGSLKLKRNAENKRSLLIKSAKEDTNPFIVVISALTKKKPACGYRYDPSLGIIEPRYDGEPQGKKK